MRRGGPRGAESYTRCFRRRDGFASTRCTRGRRLQLVLGAPGLMAILWGKATSYGCHPKLVLGCSGAFTAGVFPTAPAMGFGTVPDERHGPPPIRATRSVALVGLCPRDAGAPIGALVGLCPRDATGATPNSFWGALARRGRSHWGARGTLPARRGRSLGVPSLPAHPVT